MTGCVTSAIASSVAPASTQQPPVISCTAALETTDTVRGVSPSEVEERNKQAPGICRSSSPRPPNGLTFARRRHSKNLDSPYLSRPRMKRRGAISYDKDDAAAEYIRYLGACKVTAERGPLAVVDVAVLLKRCYSPITGDINEHRHVPSHTCTTLAELPANKREHIFL